jgi:hypothetical protein
MIPILYNGLLTLRPAVHQPQNEDGIKGEDGERDVVVHIAKRWDIEERCLKLDPPLSLESIMHLPSYKAAVSDHTPLNEARWEYLKARLLQERRAAEGRRSSSEHADRNGDASAKVKTEPRDDGYPSSLWGGRTDSVQLSNRMKLSAHAKEAVRNWKGPINADTAPRFAADVLRICRKQFLADESTRRKRLTLEDMKYVYDTEVKPLTHEHRAEMFLCNGCPNNPRWWCFEPLVQHFSAKHTYNPRGKQAKVNWRADWPDIGPFRSDPDKAKFDITPLAEPVGSPQPTRGPFRPNEFQSPAPPQWPRGFNQPIPTAPRNGYVPPYRDEFRHDRLDGVANDARDAWFQLCNVRDIPASVLVHYVIARTARKYQSKFSESIPISLFLEGLIEHPAMVPIRAANGLGCLECQRHPGKSIDGTSKADRMFPVVSLLQHFETVHIRRNKSVVAPDWIRDMVRLPHPRIISALAESGAVDSERKFLLEDIFPWAFPAGGPPNRRSSSAGGPKERSTEPGGHAPIIPSGPRHTEPAVRAPPYPAGREHGFPPVSQDRLFLIQKPGGGQGGGHFTAPRGRDEPRRERDFDPRHDPRQSAGMVRTESMGSRGAPSSYAAADSRYPRESHRRSRPSAADFMDSQAPPPEPSRYDDERYASRYPVRRSRSRSPERERERFYPMPAYPPDPRYAYPPPPPYYAPPPPHADMGEYMGPYRRSAGYYPPPPPLPMGYYPPAGEPAPRPYPPPPQQPRGEEFEYRFQAAR